MKTKKNVSVILLAGGKGTRMKAEIPKQYMPLKNKPIARYSFDLFLSMPEVYEIIVVCDPFYQPIFSTTQTDLNIKFASPGARRQDSVYHGFQMADSQANLICIHDSARPFVTVEMTRRALQAAQEHGAATVGMPIKFTVKECHPDLFVKNTPQRDLVWEVQTPQVIRPDLIKKGFKQACEHSLTVNDDVSLVELISHPVKLVEGGYQNLKITSLEDLILAESLLNHAATNL